MKLNLPGHGGEPRVRPATAERFAEAILPSVPDGSVLVGCSLGGMVALAAAALEPAKIKALVLVDVPIRAPLKFISWYTPYVAPVVTRIPGRKAIGRTVGRRIANPVGRAAFEGFLANSDPNGLADALIVAARFDGDAILGQIEVPILALCGERSLLTGKTYREKLRRLCQNVDIVEVPTGHLIQFENAEVMQAEIDRFVAGL
ncbi:MAG: alpha/beta hydrolase [Pseudomonadota bacterium]